jgi:hypothetical protein
MIALSMSLVLALIGTPRLLAQGDDKKEAPKPEAAKPAEPAKPAETTKPAETAPSASAELAPPTIPPEVQAKLEAARRAVAEAIVAAEDAGLVKTAIDPPPILDILVNGYADDLTAVKALKPGDPNPARVSPEVFGAWFTGYGTDRTIDPSKQIRVTRPESGLKKLYNDRATILKSHIDAIRKAKGDTIAKEEARKKDDEAKKQEEAKKKEDETKKPEEAKKDEPKKEEPKEDAKKDEPKKDGDEKKDAEPK